MAGLPKHFGQVGRRCVGGEAEGLHIIEPRVPKTRAGVVAPKIRDRGDQQGEAELGGKADVPQGLCPGGRSGTVEHLRVGLDIFRVW